MKSSKKTNNKPKSQTIKKDQYTVVLEDLRSNFKVFGESLDLVKDKVDSIDKRVDSIDKRVDSIDKRVDSIDKRVDSIDKRLGGVESDLEILKTEVALIRHNQVTRDEFKLLESRVLRLERKASR
ncbi:MAG: hypothetical protein COV33_01375 [Candidatus Zambryskibacteria bacterium CG10_big_fil_rev_8_21_14_0_10_34_34]|uniref:t-SNARE coiled-coil homology domain-containing protein n=1 Tax=Candidatus Zambryskibacteria bacterium CG10_big_fil_rev_8_21_14_0_10_34_34 TaxID=1975114 RepID=A0A2H0R0V2_9BACT|nr:MAG: hypothetical protein COV33_01375 [Candidatus Zambryskibacteria bacterium CG10_big_fil_rev_8_21_14_0_10_34_34]